MFIVLGFVLFGFVGYVAKLTNDSKLKKQTALIHILGALAFCLVLPNPVAAQQTAQTKKQQNSTNNQSNSNTQSANNTTQQTAGKVAESTKDFYELYGLQLQSVLKTRLQEEEDFVNQVVDLVRAEKLPKPVVDKAWLWVKNNRMASRFPFIYFERVLRLQTEKLEIEIPEFDRSIYNQARRNSDTRKRR